MPLKLSRKKKTVDAPTQDAERTASDKDARENGKKKDKSAVKHRLRNVLFAVIVILLLGVIGCMVASELLPEYTFLDIPRRAVANVMKPIEEAFSSGTGWFFDYVKRLKLRSNIEYEYEKLYDEYDELLSQVMRLNELENELNEYQDLMDEMQTHSQFDGVPARVIASDSTNYFSTFTINVGTNQGVENYMAVVKSGGLVGYTYDVTETTAKVQSIISSDTSISALIESTRYQGTVKGTLGTNGEAMCRMYYLSESHLPRQGDTVVTSGVGMEFPKGIPIGTVRESTRGMEEGKSYVVIEPIVDFERIEYVIVYRYTPSYAEEAEERDSSDGLVTSTLPTARPVPTFTLDGVGDFNVADTPTPAPEDTVTETPDPNEVLPDGSTAQPTATPTPHPTGNLSYQDIPGTATPVPTASPTPTPSPTPTFSLSDMTQEED